MLRKRQLKFVKDFIIYWMFETIEVNFEDLLKVCSLHELTEYFLFVRKKKITLIYGNCQTNIIKNMLLFHPIFRKEHIIITIPRICEFKDEDHIKSIVECSVLWKMIDLFLYQKTNQNNRFSKNLATDYLLGKLRNDCKRVSISSIYFKGYFIQNKPVIKSYDILENILEGEFLFGDKYIDEYMENDRTFNEIEIFLEEISNDNYLNKEEIEQECKKSLQELKSREKNVDVRICDYIEKYYKVVQLFFSVNHPRNSVLYEYTNRILEYLGYDKLVTMSEEDMILLFGTLRGTDQTIYPSVIKALGLKDYEKRYFPNRAERDNYLIDFKTYQKEYIRYFYL